MFLTKHLLCPKRVSINISMIFCTTLDILVKIFDYSTLTMFLMKIRKRQCLTIWQQFSKILAKKYPNRAFFVPNLGIFAFLWNFASRQIGGCWFQIWQYCFQILAQRYPNQAFSVPTLGIFVFSWNFGNRQIRGCWFQIWL